MLPPCLFGEITVVLYHKYLYWPKCYCRICRVGFGCGCNVLWFYPNVIAAFVYIWIDPCDNTVRIEPCRGEEESDIMEPLRSVLTQCLFHVDKKSVVTYLRTAFSSTVFVLDSVWLKTGLSGLHVAAWLKCPELPQRPHELPPFSGSGKALNKSCPGLL